MNEPPTEEERHKQIMDRMEMFRTNEHIDRIASENCGHEQFYSDVQIDRIVDDRDESVVKGWYACIMVFCLQCNTPFHFKGLPYGLTPDQPRTDPAGIEARMPLGLGEKALPETGTMTFEVM